MTDPNPEPGDPGPLERSQQALDEARDAARAALDDVSPAAEMDTPGTGEGLEEHDEGDLAPRPN